MSTIARADAVSHVGRVRSNNQDSAFIGEHLFVVADGMGGHAGGDVASAIAAKHYAENDAAFSSVEDAQEGLRRLLTESNALITEAVAEHSELRGMGTTSSAATLVDGKIVLGHIGDSRIYRLHAGKFTQETVDHTFVQRLVDAGRITPEEALTHPRRSVLMRVLGDVETEPEVDTSIADAVEGDRWLLCSDGLSSYVDEDKIARTLARPAHSSREIADDLVQLALDEGAPDNVTVIVLEIGPGQLEQLNPKLVGSAANPLRYTSRRQRRQSQLLPSILHPLRRQPRPEDEEYVPPSDEFLEQLIAEDRRRQRMRRIWWLAVIITVLGVLAGALGMMYSWTQDQYYVGEMNGYVTIYRGVQQDLGPVSLDEVVEVTDIPISSLPEFQRMQVRSTISCHSLDEAVQVVERLRDVTVP